MEKLLVFIPAYNCEKQVPRVLDQLLDARVAPWVGACIVVNNRSTAMYVLAETDAFTTGSGLLSECLTDGRVVTVPLQGKTSVHLGWIHLRNTRISPLTERFVHLLEEALADSIAFTRRLQEQA